MGSTADTRGEMAGREEKIHEAIEILGVERIGHGIAASRCSVDGELRKKITAGDLPGEQFADGGAGPRLGKDAGKRWRSIRWRRDGTARGGGLTLGDGLIRRCSIRRWGRSIGSEWGWGFHGGGDLGVGRRVSRVRLGRPAGFVAA